MSNAERIRVLYEKINLKNNDIEQNNTNLKNIYKELDVYEREYNTILTKHHKNYSNNPDHREICIFCRKIYEYYNGDGDCCGNWEYEEIYETYGKDIIDV